MKKKIKRLYSKDNEEIKGGSEYGKNRVYETGDYYMPNLTMEKEKKYQQENKHTNEIQLSKRITRNTN